jgi:hypothetical protein
MRWSRRFECGGEGGGKLLVVPATTEPNAFLQAILDGS